MANLKTVMQVKLDLQNLKELFGEKEYEAALKVAGVLRKYLNGGSKFTGKIVFDVNCRNGGIGSVETFVQRKI